MKQKVNFQDKGNPMDTGPDPEISGERQAVLDSLPVSVLMLNNRGTIIYSNGMIKRWIDYNPEEIIGKRIGELGFLGEEEKKRAIQKFKHRLEGKKTGPYELEFTARDGKKKTGLIRGSLIKSPGGKIRATQIIIDNVTYIRKIEEALGRLEKHLKGFFDNAVIGIYRSTSNGRILMANPALAKILGFSSVEELKELNLNDTRIGPEYDRKAFTDRLEKEGGISGLECRWFRKDGSVIFVRESARFVKESYSGTVCYEGSLENITDKKLAEQELFSEKERLSLTLKSITDAVISTDNKGKITLINKAARILTGWSAEEALSEDITAVLDLADEKTGKPIHLHTDKLLSGKDAAFPVKEALLLSVNDEKKFIEFTLGAIRDDRSRVFGLLAVFRDIEQRREIAEEASRSQRMEALGNVAGGIAHEFNNLLMGILGNISLAKMDSDREGPVYEKLAEAEKAYHRARNLTHQLLTFSRGGSPAKKPIDIKATVKDAAEFAAAGSAVKPEITVTAERTTVNADRSQLNQLVHAIVQNACEASPPKGNVEITLDTATVSPEDAPSVEEGDYVVISVKDRGEGIQPDNVDRIYDPYFTTKSGSSGLGLAAAHSIAENHHGRITVESQPGKGSIFKIYLPISEKSEPVNEPGHARASNRKGRILVMDDEQIVRYVAGKMLEHLGYEAAFAADGKEAIELYRSELEGGAPFDGVILDLTIPGGMGGKEAIKKLRKIDPAARALVSSGYSDDSVMADYRKYRFDGVMSKPYNMRELKTAVNNMLSGKKIR